MRRWGRKLPGVLRRSQTPLVKLTRISGTCGTVFWRIAELDDKTLSRTNQDLFSMTYTEYDAPEVASVSISMRKRVRRDDSSDEMRKLRRLRIVVQLAQEIQTAANDGEAAVPYGTASTIAMFSALRDQLTAQINALQQNLPSMQFSDLLQEQNLLALGRRISLLVPMLQQGQDINVSRLE